MANIYSGINGGISGKVGTVIGYMRNGKACLRSAPITVKNPKTPAQLKQRAKFRLILGLLRPITEFLRIGFQNHASKMSAFNYAMSYNMKNAIQGMYPDFAIDYDKVMLSKGSLAEVQNATVSSVIAGEVIFKWNNDSVECWCDNNDNTLILAVNPTRQEALFTIDESRRIDCSQVLSVPLSYSGETLHCYMAFSDAMGNVSNSRYVGSVFIA